MYQCEVHNICPKQKLKENILWYIVKKTEVDEIIKYFNLKIIIRIRHMKICVK